MKLVIEAQKNDDAIKVTAGFILRTSAENEANLKKIKVGNYLYPYFDEFGNISQTAGIFKHTPVGDELTNIGHFKSAADLIFAIEVKRTRFGKANEQEMHLESMELKGSKIIPSFLKIEKINLGSTTLGEDRVLPYVYVSGTFYHAQDKRLQYLPSTKSTKFGEGNFDIKNVKVLRNGNFINLVISPYAKQLEQIVDEQKEAFNKYAALYATNEDKDIWVSKYEHTRKLLKPHANEIYKYENGIVYYINSGGNWQSENIQGARDIDVDDRHRVYQYLKSNNILDKDLSSQCKMLASKPLLEQKKLTNIASALQDDVVSKSKKDLDDIDKRLKQMAVLRPTDGPLSSGDLAGLKKGVSLFPHQALVLAALKGRDRMLVDADPGAGKALIIICDILQQMKARKIQRPLIIMPESLLAQFAHEIQHFSELNPWIISTESIQKWGKTGKFPEMLEDAKRAPRNTVFLTSYNWISRDPENIPNGEISESKTKTSIEYRTFKHFNNAHQLVAKLKIDSVFMDECHVLRGSSNMAKAASYFTGLPIVRGLTGTVMPGNPFDIHGVMSPIHSSVFGTADDFKDKYTVTGSLHNYKTDAPKQIRQQLKDFGVIPVRKSAWAHLLPKTHRQVHFAEFTADQKKVYTALLTNILDEIRKDPKLSVILKKIEAALDNGDELTAAPLLARFTPLDVFLNAPSEAKEWIRSLMIGDNAISPKSKVINAIIHTHLANPDAGKVLVFVQYKEAAKNLFNNLDPDLKAHADYYEGGMAEVLNRFKTPEDPLKILIGVDKSLVVGHNLQSANCIIHADLRWLSGDMYQREARAARIGQIRDVYIHNVLVKNSAEILKQARLISSEHLIAKANSDFTDNKVLQPIQMSLPNMQSFTEEHQLTPYLERKKGIEAHVEEQNVKERDFYGPVMLHPHGYSEISKVFKDAKELKKVPSAKDFSGDANNHEDIITKDLEELPNTPKHPKLLNLGLMQWNHDWYLYSYKSADPEGFLRHFGFTLMRGYYYLEVPSKAAVIPIITKLEKHLTIINKPEFEQSVREARITSSGGQGRIKKAAQKARYIAADVKEKENDDDNFIDKSKKGEIALDFSVIDNVPSIWTHNILSSKDIELGILKRAGFQLEDALWRRKITRSQLNTFFTKLKTNYPNVRIANWDDFKSVVYTIFKGIDLTEFDDLATK